MPAPSLRVPNLLLAAIVLLGAGGCGEQETVEEPGVRGPGTVRVWNREARSEGLKPTVIRFDALRQASAGFEDLEFSSVLIRRPLSDGTMWIHSAKGRYRSVESTAARGQQELTLAGPVHFTGMYSGLPFTGSAATAIVPLGKEAVELTDVQLVHDGSVLTTPRAVLSEAATDMGRSSFRPGAAAVSALLGAVPAP